MVGGTVVAGVVVEDAGSSDDDVLVPAEVDPLPPSEHPARRKVMATSVDPRLNARSMARR